MNEDSIADLKQFISAELYQQTAQLEERITESVTERVTESVTANMHAIVDEAKNEILDAIGDTVARRDEVVDEQLGDHERRLTRLEQSAA